MSVSRAAERRSSSLTTSFRNRTGLDLSETHVKFRFNDSGSQAASRKGWGGVESDIRFYRRRASEELAAAGRAITQSARERRMILAGVFLERLKALELHR